MAPRHGSGVCQYPRSENFWDGRLPETGINVLVAYGPPLGHLDRGVEDLVRAFKFWGREAEVLWGEGVVGGCGGVGEVVMGGPGRLRRLGRWIIRCPC